jgi:hypothetical protein
MKSLLIPFFCSTLIVLISCDNEHSNNNTADDKDQLLTLERKWLEAEFALDTSYLSSIIDSTFTGISELGIENKKEALSGMYSNISQRLKDSIFIDSFTLENTIVNLYDNSAVVSFIVHTHGKNKQALTERKTRFYDVWIKKKGKWKAVASQGTKVTE